MATSIRELILQDVEDVLTALIPASPTSTDVRRVERAQLPARTQTVRPMVLIWTGTERKDQDNSEDTLCELDVHVNLLARAVSDVETEAAAWINTIVAAIMADPSRGGYAAATVEVENEIFAADIAKPEYTVAMLFAVRYYHAHGTPDA